MRLHESLEGNEANLKFLDIVQNEANSIKSNNENGEWQDMLLAESGLYEFTEEWSDSIVCHIKRIA